MDDAEKQFYNDPAFELDLQMMRLKGYLEFAREKVAELKVIADKITEQQEQQKRDDSE